MREKSRKLMNKAKALIPEIEAVAVKEAISRKAAKCLHPQKARKLIKESVTRALERRKSIEPFVFKSPIEFDVRYTNAGMADAVEFMPSAKRIDGKTIRFILDDYLEAFGAFRASIYMRGRGVYPKTCSLIFQVDLPFLKASS